jgi:hypothetical protein
LDCEIFAGENAILDKKFSLRKEDCIATEDSAVLEIPKAWMSQLEVIILDEKKALNDICGKGKGRPPPEV